MDSQEREEGTPGVSDSPPQYTQDFVGSGSSRKEGWAPAEVDPHPHPSICSMNPPALRLEPRLKK